MFSSGHLTLLIVKESNIKVQLVDQLILKSFILLLKIKKININYTDQIFINILCYNLNINIIHS